MSDFDPETGEIFERIAAAVNPKGKPLTADGAEILDPRPMQPSIRHQRAPSMFDIVRDAVRSERLRREAEESGFETFEEADDFDVGDDYDPRSPYEEHFEAAPLSELQARARAAQAELEAALEASERQPAPTDPAPAKAPQPDS